MTNKKKGIISLVTAIFGLPGILALYALVHFIMAALGYADLTSLGVFRIIRILFGFLGLISIPYFFVGIGFAIYFLTKKDPAEASTTPLPPPQKV